MDNVILYSAFTWLCPKCKRRNYLKGSVVELSEEEKEEYCFDDYETGNFICIPDEVICKKCGEHYNAMDEYDDYID